MIEAVKCVGQTTLLVITTQCQEVFRDVSPEQIPLIGFLKKNGA
jgi:hypothetical protein